MKFVVSFLFDTIFLFFVTVGHDISARILFLGMTSFDLLVHLIFWLIFPYNSLLLFDSCASYFCNFCRNRKIRKNKMHMKISCLTVFKLLGLRNLLIHSCNFHNFHTFKENDQCPNFKEKKKY